MTDIQEWYFTLDFRGLSPDVMDRCVSDVFYQLHGAIHAQGHGVVGLSLPGWRASPDPDNVRVGDRIMVVSTSRDRLLAVAEHLQGSVKNVTPAEMDLRILEVPQGLPRVVFKRNRMRQRHLKIVSDPSSTNDEIDHSYERLEEMGCFPRIFVASKGTKQNFYFEISREIPQNEGLDGHFSTYGLASGVPRSVPMFQFASEAQ